MNEGASPVFQAVVPSALRPEHVRLQTSATDCEPCLTPAHTTKVSLCRKHTQRCASEYIKSSTHIEEYSALSHVVSPTRSSSLFTSP